jgi:histidinol dehydrogenase
MAADIRIIDSAEARGSALRRRLVGEEQPSAQAQARTEQIFGAPLTPAQVVDKIVGDVQARGDAAVRDYTARLDGADIDRFELTRDEIEAGRARIPAELLAALEHAAANIAAFHRRQLRNTWVNWDGGQALGQLVRPLERVGIYAPGGRADYPSTVLMAAVPARVAGVSEVVLATPPGRDGQVAPATLAAAAVAGVHRVFRIGGAQAIAALAYGTESVPRVDKILGPGNIFVALAKRKVFGQVAIDSIAGPTETLVLADESADPALVAADLLAQAEHDPMAVPLCITPSRALAERVRAEVVAQVGRLSRQAIAADSLAANGAIVVTRDLAEAVALANEYAPEHLCLAVRDAWSLLGEIRNAGAVFVGEESAEAMGDYVSGPSHILPTSGTARFYSPVTVEDFIKTTSVIAVGREALRRDGPAAIAIAESEGLSGHAEAVRARLRRVEDASEGEGHA